MADNEATVWESYAMFVKDDHEAAAMALEKAEKLLVSNSTSCRVGGAGKKECSGLCLPEEAISP